RSCPRHRPDGRSDEGRLGDRRHRGRAGRQLRADGSGQGDLASGRDHRRAPEHPKRDGLPGLAALLAQRPQFPHAPLRPAGEEDLARSCRRDRQGLSDRARRGDAAAGLGGNMIDLGLIGDLYVFVLAGFLGYQVISRVSPLLHTPLMSATNAISGISLVGSLVVAGAGYNRVSTLMGFIAVTASTINVVGGFLITDRILKMFRARK